VKWQSHTSHFGGWVLPPGVDELVGPADEANTGTGCGNLFSQFLWQALTSHSSAIAAGVEGG